MYGLVAYGAPLFGVPEATSVQGPSQHYTIVFNAFVLMQLFNQVGTVLCSECTLLVSSLAYCMACEL